MTRSPLALRALLLLALAAALLRLAILALGFARYGLQVDFSAYYTAAEAALAGLSPYANQVGHQPPIWDGLCFTTFSRFLYPPPSLLPFLGLALLPYAAAKLLWTALLLGLSTKAVVLGARLAGVPLRSRAVALVALGLAVCWPLLLSLERGQIDVVVLVLLLSRNLVKAYFERRQRLLGSGFRTKLIAAFVITVLFTAFVGVFAMTKMKAADDADTKLYEMMTKPIGNVGKIMQYTFIILALIIFSLIVTAMAIADSEINQIKKFTKSLQTFKRKTKL